MRALFILFTFMIVTTPINLARAQGWGVGCVNHVCVMVDPKGKFYYYNADQIERQDGGNLAGAQGPVQVSCSFTTQWGELCVAVDARGQIWQGNVRPNSQGFVKVR